MECKRSTEELATICAKRIAKEWGRKKEWRDYLTPCYYGVKKARDKGKSDGEVYLNALSAVKDLLRTENQTRRLYNKVPHHQLVDFCDELGEQEEVSPETRLLELWTDTKPIRRSFSIRTRIVLYLYTVEGLTMLQVGEHLDLAEPTISQIIKKFTDATLEEPSDVGTTKGSSNEGSSSEELSGKEETRELSSEVQHAGYVTEGDTDSSSLSQLATRNDQNGAINSDRSEGASRSRENKRGEEDILSGASEQRLDSESISSEGTNGGTTTRPVSTNTEVTICNSGRRSVGAIVASLPEEGETVSKAKVLRDGLLDSLGSDDMKDVMQAVLKRAKGGNLQAAKLLFNLIGSPQ